VPDVVVGATVAVRPVGVGLRGRKRDAAGLGLEGAGASAQRQSFAGQRRCVVATVAGGESESREQG
jgi:hypothetical protein